MSPCEPEPATSQAALQRSCERCGPSAGRTWWHCATLSHRHHERTPSRRRRRPPGSIRGRSDVGDHRRAEALDERGLATTSRPAQHLSHIGDRARRRRHGDESRMVVIGRARTRLSSTAGRGRLAARRVARRVLPRRFTMAGRGDVGAPRGSRPRSTHRSPRRFVTADSRTRKCRLRRCARVVPRLGRFDHAVTSGCRSRWHTTTLDPGCPSALGHSALRSRGIVCVESTCFHPGCQDRRGHRSQCAHRVRCVVAASQRCAAPHRASPTWRAGDPRRRTPVAEPLDS